MNKISPVALSGYRRLIRATKKAFGSDKQTMNMAKIQLKVEFLNNRNVTDQIQLAELNAGIDEAEEMLLFHIVQGKKNNNGNYGWYYN